MKIRLTVLKDVAFSRLVFFQFGSETYNYNALFDKFVVGSVGGPASTHTEATHPRTCTGATSKKSNKMYTGGPFRKKMEGTAPFYFAYGSNTAVPPKTADMVVGDRGFIINSYQAKLNGVDSTSPSYSVLCDKIEIGAPADVLTLIQDDFVEMTFEIIVLPRLGDDFAAALVNSGNSLSLQKLQPFTTQGERMKAQALGSKLSVTTLLGPRARIESHYPIRVCATGTHGTLQPGTPERTEGDTGVLFQVSGSALGHVPIVICGLKKHDIPSATQGLWMRSSASSTFELLDQSTTAGKNDFYQVNYVRASQSYEVVYNVELFNAGGSATTIIGFGSKPDTWPAAPVMCDSISSVSVPTITDLCANAGGLGLIATAATVPCASTDNGCTIAADADKCCQQKPKKTAAALCDSLSGAVLTTVCASAANYTGALIAAASATSCASVECSVSDAAACCVVVDAVVDLSPALSIGGGAARLSSWGVTATLGFIGGIVVFFV